MLACFLTGEERLSAGVQTGGIRVPFLAALRWLNRLRRVGALLPGLGPLPVGDVRGMQLQRGEVLGLRPCQRAAVLAPYGGTRGQVYRQVRRVKQVAPQRLAEVQPVVVPEVGAESPAVLPKEVGEA